MRGLSLAYWSSDFILKSINHKNSVIYCVMCTLVTEFVWYVACVSSVPVRAERNIGPREGVFAFRMSGKWGEFLPRPFCSRAIFRALNAKTLFAALYFVRLVWERLLCRKSGMQLQLGHRTNSCSAFSIKSYLSRFKAHT